MTILILGSGDDEHATHMCDNWPAGAPTRSCSTAPRFRVR